LPEQWKESIIVPIYKKGDGAGHVACMGQSSSAYRVLVGKPEEKRSHARPRHRWKDNNKMNLREVRLVREGAWTGSIWLRIGTDGGLCDCSNGPTGSIKCGVFLEWLRTC
jgi:hypothetical protein